MPSYEYILTQMKKVNNRKIDSDNDNRIKLMVLVLVGIVGDV